MSYTVNQLAKISGVSIRTLHHYDEIGLLKPAYYGENNYRYYEEEQLLLLQQILFYRELNIPLSDIEKIMKSDGFNKLEALKAHRDFLMADLERKKNLIKTLDKTIAHLRGEQTMKHEELYYGFDSEKQKHYEKELMNEGVIMQERMNKYKAKTSQWTPEEKDRFMQEGKDINQALISAINKKLDPSSEKVQAIIRRHHSWVGWNPTQAEYVALSERYHTPEFKQFYEHLHPQLLKFITMAMKVFAEHKLS